MTSVKIYFRYLFFNYIYGNFLIFAILHTDFGSFELFSFAPPPQIMCIYLASYTLPIGVVTTHLLGFFIKHIFELPASYITCIIQSWKCNINFLNVDSSYLMLGFKTFLPSQPRWLPY